MTMDGDGNVYLAGSRPGEIPIVIACSQTGASIPRSSAGGTLDGATMGLTGRATGLLVRREGSLTFTVGGGATGLYPASFTVVRVGLTGVLDTTFNGTGIVSLPLGPGQAAGIGAAAIRQGPSNTTLVAGTD